MDLHGFGNLLFQGTLMTVALALCSLGGGLLLGLAGASAKLSPNPLARWLGGAYTTVVRGLPELLVVLVIYFGSAGALNAAASLIGYDDYIELGRFQAGVIALSLTFGAYATEVFRGAIQSIPKGQIEAAIAYGMTPIQCFLRITLPQVWRVALPGLGNLFLVLMKDTSLVSVIGLDELMRQASIATGFTKEPFTFYVAAALIYLALTLIFGTAQGRLEKWAARGQPAAGTAS
ncbi:MAG: ABC transporter permease [Magnetovibrionaceae bacterium]